MKWDRRERRRRCCRDVAEPEAVAALAAAWREHARRSARALSDSLFVQCWRTKPSWTLYTPGTYHTLTWINTKLYTYTYKRTRTISYTYTWRVLRIQQTQLDNTRSRERQRWRRILSNKCYRTQSACKCCIGKHLIMCVYVFECTSVYLCEEPSCVRVLYQHVYALLWSCTSSENVHTICIFDKLTMLPLSAVCLGVCYTCVYLRMHEWSSVA